MGQGSANSFHSTNGEAEALCRAILGPQLSLDKKPHVMGLLCDAPGGGNAVVRRGVFESSSGCDRADAINKRSGIGPVSPGPMGNRVFSPPTGGHGPRNALAGFLISCLAHGRGARMLRGLAAGLTLGRVGPVLICVLLLAGCQSTGRPHSSIVATEVAADRIATRATMIDEQLTQITGYAPQKQTIAGQTKGIRADAGEVGKKQIDVQASLDTQAKKIARYDEDRWVQTAIRVRRYWHWLIGLTIAANVIALLCGINPLPIMQWIGKEIVRFFPAMNIASWLRDTINKRNGIRTLTVNTRPTTAAVPLAPTITDADVDAAWADAGATPGVAVPPATIASGSVSLGVADLKGSSI